jgi:tetratricopeptide (TPR) repeat protein
VWVEDDDLDAARAEPRDVRRSTTTRRASRTTAGPTGATPSPSPAGRSRVRKRVPQEIASEIEKEAGARRSGRLVDRLADATRAYERERYRDARSILRPLAEEAPGSAAVRELLGLTEYRLGHWRDASRQLEAFRSLSGSVEQHPVLADSYRALRRHRRVDELWEELRAASPSSELVTEGRIVMAGSLADRGDIPGAIRLLEKGRLDRRNPQEHHLRQWYALANLYERSGDIPRARDLFQRVAAHDPDTFDVTARARALR